MKRRDEVGRQYNQKPEPPGNCKILLPARLNLNTESINLKAKLPETWGGGGSPTTEGLN